MVKKEKALYLLIGQDSFSKNIKLKQIRQQLLGPDTEQFNLDILYAKEINLRQLQEKLLCLPIEAKRRMVVVKGAEFFKKDIQEFILKYVKNPYPGVILVLDFTPHLTRRGVDTRRGSQGEFISQIHKYSLVYRFKEQVPPDTFMLTRYIDRRQSPYALRLLSQLLKNGERPELILGGLRYAYQKDTRSHLDKRTRLKLILDCDLEIKTGRLKPSFALERLVVRLCCLSQSFA